MFGTSELSVEIMVLYYQVILFFFLNIFIEV